MVVVRVRKIYFARLCDDVCVLLNLVSFLVLLPWIKIDKYAISKFANNIGVIIAKLHKKSSTKQILCKNRLQLCRTFEALNEPKCFLEYL